MIDKIDTVEIYLRTRSVICHNEILRWSKSGSPEMIRMWRARKDEIDRVIALYFGEQQ